MLQSTDQKRRDISEDGKREVLSDVDGLRSQHQRSIQRAQGGERFLRRNTCLQRRPASGLQGITPSQIYTNTASSNFLDCKYAK